MNRKEIEEAFRPIVKLISGAGQGTPPNIDDVLNAACAALEVLADFFVNVGRIADSAEINSQAADRLIEATNSVQTYELKAK